MAGLCGYAVPCFNSEQQYMIEASTGHPRFRCILLTTIIEFLSSNTDLIVPMP